jgi:hypothetical protein
MPFYASQSGFDLNITIFSQGFNVSQPLSCGIIDVKAADESFTFARLGYIL